MKTGNFTNIKIIFLFFFFSLQCFDAQVTIAPVGSPATLPNINLNDIDNICTISNNYRGLTKISSVDPSNNYQATFNNNTWNSGAWFRGYFSGFEDTLDKRTKFYNENWSSHPLARSTSKVVRGLIHYNNFRGENGNANYNLNIDQIVDGLKYLQTQIQPSGGVIWWFERPGLNTFDQDDTPGANNIHIYETGHTLATLCDGYMYLKKINKLDRVPNLIQDINKIAGFIEQIPVPTTDILDPSTQYNTADYMAFGLWGLSKAYKVTKNCNYLNKVTEICNWFIAYQSLDNTNNEECKGTWKFSSQTENNVQIYSNTKIVYHLVCVRGLIEAFDIIPASSSIRENLSNTIKLGVNHIIKKRVRESDQTLSWLQFDTNCQTLANIDYAYYYDNDQVEPIALLAYYATLHNDLFNNSEKEYLKNFLIKMSLYSGSRILPSTNNQGDYGALIQMHSWAYYVDYYNAITHGYKIFAEDGNPYYDSNKVMNKMVSGDFDNDGKQDDIAAFYDYGGDPINGMTTELHVLKGTGSNFNFSSSSIYWQAPNYNSAQIVGNTVSGDFDNDGKQDDIALFYDLGTDPVNGAKTAIHVFKGNVNSFEYSGTNGFWQSQGYDSGKITDRIVSGDFDNDGKVDDIAAFYDYGTGGTRIHVFRGTGSGFEYLNGADGFWQQTSYDANKITGKIVSGDFDNDGNFDDIAAFYDDGNTANGIKTSIHVFKGTGTGFDYSDPNGFWNTTGYDSNKITGRVVSGDFDNDGKYDDIIAFYDYGSNETRAHIFRSTGTGFEYLPYASDGFWQNINYKADNITGRLISGDFDNDGNFDDIAGFKNNTNQNSSINVWLSSNHDFQYTGIDNWFGCGSNSNNIFIAAKSPNNYNSIEYSVSAKNQNEIVVYPNPADDIINIKYQLKEKGSVLINISTFEGRRINIQPYIKEEKGIYNKVYNIKRYHLTKGTYLVEIYINNILHTKKIIIK
ncbi:T9SS type A sorting domain-containing protein [Chryseobacterium defluvii]|uniref:Putative secreted protein (Por secretion system target) n=1 Tax=Chryseobacterium defluvii TaxID=160396 RepID=A0A495SA31_9FLAO|nr:T9SS type A sorting domain-containing protein [Chryseobacterium defluvii]RKS96763.1 putative secreted protein (Por secretion system target) [Chryseobacterium defluvii]